MANLGLYYKSENDYYNMVKYYRMVADKNNMLGICNLAHHYKIIKDYDNMIIYALKVFSLNEYNFIEDIIDYYMLINCHNLIVHYNWLSLTNLPVSDTRIISDARIINIATKFIQYLQKCNSKIENIFEVYNFCHNNRNYDDYILRTLKKIMNCDNSEITMYFGKRYMKIYKMINIFVKCSDICEIICVSK